MKIWKKKTFGEQLRKQNLKTTWKIKIGKQFEGKEKYSTHKLAFNWKWAMLKN